MPALLDEFKINIDTSFLRKSDLSKINFKI
jgi:hypothetical protein